MLPLPKPENYATWQDFANALLSVLGQGALESAGVDRSLYYTATNVEPSSLPDYPAGFRPMWLTTDEAEMYLGNPAFDPPTAPDLFTIDTQHIADAAIEVNKLNDSAVTEAKLALAAVTSNKIATGAVINAKLADLVVDAAKLANLAVTTGKINDFAVTTTKIANLAVGSAQIADASIVNAKIGLLAVGGANIIDAAIGTAKIADAAILTAKIADAAISTAKIGTGVIVTAHIGDAQIVEAKIADLAVNTAKIANAAITSAKIANLAVGAANIQLASITAAQIADGTISNAKIGNTIQSASWNPTTKQGWSIDKTGLIQGSGLAIYDTSGNLVFGSGGTLDFARVIGTTRPSDNAGTTIILTPLSGSVSVQGNTITNIAGANTYAAAASAPGSKGMIAFSCRKRATGFTMIGLDSTAGSFDYALQDWQIQTFGDTWWVFHNKTGATYATGTLPFGTLELIVAYDKVNLLAFADGTLLASKAFTSPTGFLYPMVWAYTSGTSVTDIKSDMSFLAQFSSANISTLIASAAIGTALIANAAIVNALIANLAVATGNIQDAAIDTAKIANLAVSSGKIIDAAITSAKIADANITTAKIADAAISTAKIADAAIGSAKIADAAIVAAKIGTAEIDTIKLAGQAVTIAVSAYTAAAITCPSNTVWTEVQTATIVSTGAPIVVRGQLFADHTDNISTAGVANSFRLLRNGTVILGPRKLAYYSNAGFYGSGFTSFMMVDQPGVGTWTYSIECIRNSAGGSATLNPSDRTILLMETKR